MASNEGANCKKCGDFFRLGCNRGERFCHKCQPLPESFQKAIEEAQKEREKKEKREQKKTLIRVSKLKSKLMEIEGELSRIRADCKHPGYYTGLWSWRIGCIEASRICNVCEIAIPGITDEERKYVEECGGTQSHVFRIEENL